MKIAVINFSGNTGKSVLSKNMLIPLLPGAKRISIEDINDPGGRSDATITASMFPSLAAELNAFDEDKHFVLDIGASSAKEMVGHFTRLATTRSDIDVWIVPVTRSRRCGGRWQSSPGPKRSSHLALSTFIRGSSIARRRRSKRRWPSNRASWTPTSRSPRY